MSGVSWNHWVTKLLLTWREQLRLTSTAHSAAAKSLSKKGTLLSIFLFAISLLNSTVQLSFSGSSAQTSNPDSYPSWQVGIAIGVLGLFVTGMIQARDHLDYYGKSSSHEAARRECERLINRIDTMLVASVRDRPLYFGSAALVLQNFEIELQRLSTQYEQVETPFEFAKPSSDAPGSSNATLPQVLPIQPGEIEDSVTQDTLRLGRLALEESEPPNAKNTKVDIGFNIFDSDRTDYLQHQLQVFNDGVHENSPIPRRKTRRKRERRLEGETKMGVDEQE